MFDPGDYITDGRRLVLVLSHDEDGQMLYGEDAHTDDEGQNRIVKLNWKTGKRKWRWVDHSSSWEDLLSG